ncbi:MAG: hypothetical protein ABR574_07730 [Cryomorphaceae bacterium]|nr:hypothetical protein [Flavobacteriales bacterium]
MLSALSFNSKAQDVSCDELKDFIVEEGFRKASISSYTLDSEWLHEVTAYTYEMRTYVVAEIKNNAYSYSTNAYVFCSIPSSNWSSFRNGGYGDSDSYGERFHKYIIDYRCNCY